MGTNYYLHSDVCAHCGRSDAPIHIGKSSAGWCFALHVHPDNGIHDLVDWRSKIEDKANKIFDEYGDEITPSDMIDCITNRTWHGSSDHSQEWYDLNYAQPGPNGLSRHRPDGLYCIAIGDGTYDLLVGDFS